jgi:hypothetical protein
MKQLGMLLVVLSLGATACSGSPTVVVGQLETEVARALAQTQAAYSPTPAATDTDAPTATPAPTDTPAATDTPEPTNTPRPTATRRPTATPDIGTLDNPFPYGIEVPLTWTGGGQSSEWSLQVLEVIRGDDANRLARQANTFNDDPPAGASWMFVKVKVTLTGGDAMQFDYTDLVVISGGQMFDAFDFSVCCTDDMGYRKLEANIAVPGTSVEGWIIRPVMLDDAEPRLALNIDMFNPDLDEGLFFDLSP